MGKSDRKRGGLSALYVNTGEMRCDHRGSGTNGTLFYLRREPANTAADRQVRE